MSPYRKNFISLSSYFFLYFSKFKYFNSGNFLALVSLNVDMKDFQ